MKEVRYFFVPNAANLKELPAEEAKHAMRVLRLGVGDEMFLMDGNGYFHRAVITLAAPHHCGYDIIETFAHAKGWEGSVNIAVAPTKMMDRMEWFAEKSTEIGIDSLTMLDCRFSERRQVREDRLEKIVVGAVKQSRKAYMPKVEGMTKFLDFVKATTKGARFIAHCYDKAPRKDLWTELQALPKNEDVTVMIGPEGDFSIDEVRMAMDCGWTGISLGEARLRTETAALMACTMAQLSKR